MDSLDRYRQIIEDALSYFVGIKYANAPEIDNHPLFDRTHDHYAIVSTGWMPNERSGHGCLLHLQIKNGKIWIHRDGTEDGIADDLLAAGVPYGDIVLAFHRPEIRPYTEFATG